MSEFMQTMRDWRRMCKAYTTDDESCCDGCPVVDLHKHGCGAIFEMEDGTNWERYEGQIREWAAEHPEPVYPTWGEWFLTTCQVPLTSDLRHNDWETLLGSHIPADIAQKLGLQPKEGA